MRIPLWPGQRRASDPSSRIWRASEVRIGSLARTGSPAQQKPARCGRSWPTPLSARVPLLILALSAWSWAGAGEAVNPQLVFPQVVQGGGAVSEIVVSNPSRNTDSGRIDFFDPLGRPLSLQVDGTSRTSVDYSIPPGGVFKIEAASNGTVQTGYVTLTSDLADTQVTASIVYRFKGTEVSIPATAPTRQHHIVVERGPSANSAVALVNALDHPVDVQLRLFDQEGLSVSQKAIGLGPHERIARFLDEVFEGLDDFEAGSLHADSTDLFTMISLRQRDSGSLSALPGSDRILPLPGPAPASPFQAAVVLPDFVLNGEGSNIDSLAFWSSEDASQTFLFVTAKGNQLVEVWPFPFQSGELDPIREPFGSGRVNGILVDPQADLLYVAQAQPTSQVFVFSLPELQLIRQFGSHPLIDDFGSEPGLGLLNERISAEKRLYVTVDHIVHVFRAATGELIHQFQPGGPGSFETIQADDRNQLLYIPDENDQRGVFAYRFDGTPTDECSSQADCQSPFGSDVFQDDGEGITLYTCPSSGEADNGSGWIVVSDQRNSRTDFEFFDRVTWNHLGTLQIEGVGNTDGIASLQRSLPGYPLGLFAAVDDDKETVVVGWHKILAATGLSCP